MDDQKTKESLYADLQMPDGTYHVSKEIIYFKDLQKGRGKEYTDAGELIDDFAKFWRFMDHFDQYEKESDQDLGGNYPSFALFATIKKNQHHSAQQRYVNNKPVPYRVLKISLPEKGEYNVELANPGRSFHFSELNFYIKTAKGLFKLK